MSFEYKKIFYSCTIRKNPRNVFKLQVKFFTIVLATFLTIPRSFLSHRVMSRDAYFSKVF